MALAALDGERRWKLRRPVTSTPMDGSGEAVHLDPLIHEAARLRLVSLLSECDSADFTFLLAATGLTRGNLSTHLSKLVAAAYVDERKEFAERKPRSSYRLTKAGRNAYARYLADWRRLTRSPRR
jgi:DNA-binding transcriptional ArsR family regulator